jgi:cytosine/adenosine deaminase-related metal-dependent hydrolase
MATLFIKNAHILTMDNHQTEFSDGGLFIRDGFIEQIGKTADLPQSADEVLDLKGHVLLPGLVNTHHHFYQTLTRAVDARATAKAFLAGSAGAAG